MDNKLREEIEDKYKWNLSSVYSSTEKLEEDYKKVKEGLKTLASKSETFCTSGVNLYNFLKLDDSITIILEKIFKKRQRIYQKNCQHLQNTVD